MSDLDALDATAVTDALPQGGLTALAHWRASGADRVDPVRFRFIEAMARRSEQLQGSAQRLLHARVAALLADYGERVERALSVVDSGRPAAPIAVHRSPLVGLTDTLSEHAAARARNEAAPGLPPSLVGAAELPCAQYFRSTWAQLSAQKRLTASLAKQPENAGPLNSQRLIHRALSLMRELSPAYLQRFMAHVDTLLWMEQAQAAPAGKDAAKGKAKAVKAAPKTVRKPRGKAA